MRSTERPEIKFNFSRIETDTENTLTHTHRVDCLVVCSAYCSVACVMQFNYFLRRSTYICLQFESILTENRLTQSDKMGNLNYCDCWFRFYQNHREPHSVEVMCFSFSTISLDARMKSARTYYNDEINTISESLRDRISLKYFISLAREFWLRHCVCHLSKMLWLYLKGI